MGVNLAKLCLLVVLVTQGAKSQDDIAYETYEGDGYSYETDYCNFYDTDAAKDEMECHHEHLPSETVLERVGNPAARLCCSHPRSYSFHDNCEVRRRRETDSMGELVFADGTKYG